MQLTSTGRIDWDALACAVNPETQCALLQRSCGYSWRDTLTIDEIERAVAMIKVMSLILEGKSFLSSFMYNLLTSIATVFIQVLYNIAGSEGRLCGFC